MDEIAELFIAAMSIAIYGTDDKPRHPIWRNSVRLVAFCGAFVSIASLSGWLNDTTFPMALVVTWGVCALIVLSAEYYVGSKKVCYAALTVFAIWLLVVLTSIGLF